MRELSRDVVDVSIGPQWVPVKSLQSPADSRPVQVLQPYLGHSLLQRLYTRQGNIIKYVGPVIIAPRGMLRYLY